MSVINQKRQILLQRDVEDGGWVAQVPSLPGCISQGETREEAIENIQDAIQVWLEGAADSGIDIPEETFSTETLFLDTSF